jgi:radical SAM superfamily enzyme YgiQ (UPF0313 family)
VNRVFESLLFNPYDIETIPQEHGHLGLEYIAAFQRSHGQSTSILDANFLGLGPAIAAREIRTRNPDVIGFSLFERGLDTNARLAARVKRESRNPRLHVTAGGLYASLHSETLLRRYPAFDSIVLFDGEETFTDLVDALKEGRPLASVRGIMYRSSGTLERTPLRPPLRDLDGLPRPARIFVPGQDALAVMASRGCYGRCKFCSTNAFNRNQDAPRVRIRSVENVLDELSDLYAATGIRRVWFNDANLCAPNSVQPGWVESLAQGILERELPIQIFMLCRANDVRPKRFALLKRAGLVRVAVGFESIHRRVLDYLQKDTTPEVNLRAFEILRNLDVQVLSAYIMFDPYSTLEELGASIDFLVRFHRQLPFYRTATNRSRLIVYESTEMYRSVEQDGLLSDNEYRYDFIHPEIERVWQMVSLWKRHVRNLHRYGRMVDACIARGLEPYPRQLRQICLDYLDLDVAFFRQCLRWAGAGLRAGSRRFRHESADYIDRVQAMNRTLDELAETLEQRFEIYVWAQDHFQKTERVIPLMHSETPSCDGGSRAP